MMNGTIEVKSRQGEGTEVIISVSFRLRSSLGIFRHTEAEKTAGTVIDNDFDTCDRRNSSSYSIGMRRCTMYAGGILRTHRTFGGTTLYSVYIIDWMLPDMNGSEVPARIATNAAETPLIILTAYDGQTSRTDARSAVLPLSAAASVYVRSAQLPALSGGER